MVWLGYLLGLCIPVSNENNMTYAMCRDIAKSHLVTSRISEMHLTAVWEMHIVVEDDGGIVQFFGPINAMFVGLQTHEN